MSIVVGNESNKKVLFPKITGAELSVSSKMSSSRVNPPPKKIEEKPVVNEKGQQDGEKIKACVRTSFYVALAGFLIALVIATRITQDEDKGKVDVVVPGKETSNISSAPIKFNTTSELIAAVDTYDGVGTDSWDVSGLTNFDNVLSMVRSPSTSNFPCNLTSAWNVSSAISMVGMFEGNTVCDANLSSWDVSNVITMDHMFRGAERFTGMGLEMWSISSVSSMEFMFAETASFAANLSSWDVVNTTSINGMFYGTKNFIGIGINEWSISNSTTFVAVFCNSSVSPFVYPGFIVDSNVSDSGCDGFEAPTSGKAL